MTYPSTRSLIAGLGFTLIAASAMAQTSVSPQGAGPQGGVHRQHQAAAKGGSDSPMGQIPQAVIDQLALAPAQQAQFDTAQAARKELQATKQSLRAEQRTAMQEQLTKDIVDPRAVMAQQKTMRTAIEAKMDVVQQKWLAFWDGLSAPQKTTLSNYMKSKHAAHTHKKPVAAKG
jgi:uncharacterized membrane protein